MDAITIHVSNTTLHGTGTWFLPKPNPNSNRPTHCQNEKFRATVGRTNWNNPQERRSTNLANMLVQCVTTKQSGKQGQTCKSRLTYRSMLMVLWTLLKKTHHGQVNQSVNQDYLCRATSKLKAALRHMLTFQKLDRHARKNAIAIVQFLNHRELLNVRFNNNHRSKCPSMSLKFTKDKNLPRYTLNEQGVHYQQQDRIGDLQVKKRYVVAYDSASHLHLMSQMTSKSAVFNGTRLAELRLKHKHGGTTAHQIKQDRLDVRQFKTLAKPVQKQHSTQKKENPESRRDRIKAELRGLKILDRVPYHRLKLWEKESNATPKLALLQAENNRYVLVVIHNKNIVLCNSTSKAITSAKIGLVEHALTSTKSILASLVKKNSKAFQQAATEGSFSLQDNADASTIRANLRQAIKLMQAPQSIAEKQSAVSKQASKTRPESPSIEKPPLSAQNSTQQKPVAPAPVTAIEKPEIPVTAIEKPEIPVAATATTPVPVKPLQAVNSPQSTINVPKRSIQPSTLASKLSKFFAELRSIFFLNPKKRHIKLKTLNATAQAKQAHVMGNEKPNSVLKKTPQTNDVAYMVKQG